MDENNRKKVEDIRENMASKCKMLRYGLLRIKRTVYNVLGKENQEMIDKIIVFLHNCEKSYGIYFETIEEQSDEKIVKIDQIVENYLQIVENLEERRNYDGMSVESYVQYLEEEGLKRKEAKKQQEQEDNER